MSDWLKVGTEMVHGKEDITQLPWSATEGSDGTYILGRDGYIFGVMWKYGNDGASRPHKTNAAFIVRACNNHKALLDALEQISNLGQLTHSFVFGQPIVFDHQKIARAAIASAEKE